MVEPAVVALAVVLDRDLPVAALDDLAGEGGREALEVRQERLELESSMTPMNLKMAMLDRMEAIYRELPLEQVKLVNLGLGQGVEALLTNAAAAFKQASVTLDDASE